jgi:hypothetical protein
MLKQIPAKGARLTPMSIITRVEGGTVFVREGLKGGETRRDDIDTIVVVGDTVANDTLFSALEEAAPRARILAAGDCVAPRYLDMAMLEGHRAGRAA